MTVASPYWPGEGGGQVAAARTAPGPPASDDAAGGGSAAAAAQGGPLPAVHVRWPSATGLSVYAQGFGAHALFPGTSFVVDPITGRIVQRWALHGSVIAAIGAADGEAALLVSSVDRIGSTRLALISPAGKF